jgi:phage shock protein A
MYDTKSKSLADKLWDRYEKEKRYYKEDADNLLREAAEEIQSLDSRCKSLSDAWARAEERIATLLQDNAVLARSNQEFHTSLDSIRNICHDVLSNV